MVSLGCQRSGRSVRLSLPPKGERPILVHPAPCDKERQRPTSARRDREICIEGRIRWIRKVYGPDQIRPSDLECSGVASLTDVSGRSGDMR